MSNAVKLLQTSSDKVQIYIQNEIANKMFIFDSKDNIKGIDCSDTHLLI